MARKAKDSLQLIFAVKKIHDLRQLLLLYAINNNYQFKVTAILPGIESAKDNVHFRLYFGLCNFINFFLVPEPTAPLSPEVYIIQHKNATASHQTLAADFRWGTPKHPNGIINHHLVNYWKEGESRTVIRLKGTARHFILTPLDKSKIYYFQVCMLHLISPVFYVSFI